MRDALAFLTILPVGARDRPPGRRSLLAFPLVGLAVGVVWALAAYGASWLWGPWPAAAVVILADLALTGGLHLDAVADVADGWASRLPTQRALEVMRDPAIGAVGAASLGAVLLARHSSAKRRRACKLSRNEQARELRSTRRSSTRRRSKRSSRRCVPLRRLPRLEGRRPLKTRSREPCWSK